jgi:PAT family beta-lactamase induction signal transducer AmpG
VVWPAIYASCAALMVIGVIGTLLAHEPAEPPAPPSSLRDAAWRPLASLIRQPGAAIVIGFVVWYRLCDFFATGMIIPFLKRGLGFSWDEIATAYQLLGLAGTIAGGLFGGTLVARYGVRRCLLAFGILQAATNLGWAGLASIDRALPLLAVTVVVDNVAGAMAGGAFVAYLMSRCDRAISAGQFALYTSLSSVLAKLLGFASAELVVAHGWSAFWLTTAAMVVPALVLLRWLPVTAPRSPPESR